MKTRLFLLSLAFAGAAFSQQGYTVLVNKSNPIKSISKAQLRQMIMGETASWSGGIKVTVLLGPIGEGPRGAALKEACGMGESEFAKHGLQSSFGGANKGAVKTLPSASSIRMVVQLTPGAIGIVDAPGDTSQVKVLPIE